MEKVLIIEDEVDIAQLVAFNLERNGYIVDQVHDGLEGLEKILKDQPDLVTPAEPGIHIRKTYGGHFQTGDAAYIAA